MTDDGSRDIRTLCARHLHFGWWSLLVFVVSGTVLESMHAFKVGWYLGQGSELRRLLWTLAHAHGATLSLVHVAFAFTYSALPAQPTRRVRISSALLIGSSVLLPGGFFLGGTFIFEGDPGVGIWLVPGGALCLFLAVLLTAVDLRRLHRGSGAKGGERARRGSMRKGSGRGER